MLGVFVFVCCLFYFLVGKHVVCFWFRGEHVAFFWGGNMSNGFLSFFWGGACCMVISLIFLVFNGGGHVGCISFDFSRC